MAEGEALGPDPVDGVDDALAGVALAVGAHAADGEAGHLVLARAFEHLGVAVDEIDGGVVGVGAANGDDVGGLRFQLKA